MQQQNAAILPRI